MWTKLDLLLPPHPIWLGQHYLVEGSPYHVVHLSFNQIIDPLTEDPLTSEHPNDSLPLELMPNDLDQAFLV